MANRARDWLAQAERDLRHAQTSRDAGDHDWSCFAAHQAAEKAVKALHLLDTFYIPARYPNSHPEGPPFEHYGPLQSEEGIRHAGQIVAFVRSQMA